MDRLTPESWKDPVALEREERRYSAVQNKWNVERENNPYLDIHTKRDGGTRLWYMLERPDR